MGVFGCLGMENQALKNLVNSIFSRTSVIFTNVVGPYEEISFFDHEISYIAASSCGVPQVLCTTHKTINIIKNHI